QADLAKETLSIEPVDLVYAALIFEHAGTSGCFENAVRMVARGGRLAIVLQLPSESTQAVAPTPYESMKTLKAHFSIVSPKEIASLAEKAGFVLSSESKRELPGGKGFWLGIFEK